MANDRIETICVVGSGHMGWILGFQCAVHGYPVWIYDIDENSLQRARGHIEQELRTRVDQQQITPQEEKSILEQIQFTLNLEEAVIRSDLVFESAPEKLELKRDIFAELDRLSPEHTILATGSSALPISQIEDVTQRLDRVINTHYYPPIWQMPMADVMRGTSTSDKTVARVQQFMRNIDVTPLMVL